MYVAITELGPFWIRVLSATYLIDRYGAPNLQLGISCDKIQRDNTKTRCHGGWIIDGSGPASA